MYKIIKISIIFPIFIYFSLQILYILSLQNKLDECVYYQNSLLINQQQFCTTSQFNSNDVINVKNSILFQFNEKGVLTLLQLENIRLNASFYIDINFNIPEFIQNLDVIPFIIQGFQIGNQNVTDGVAIEGKINLFVNQNQQIDINFYQIGNLKFYVNQNLIQEENQINSIKINIFSSNLTLQNNQIQIQRIQNSQNVQIKILNKNYSIQTVNYDTNQFYQELYAFLRIQDIFQSICRYAVVVNDRTLTQTQVIQNFDIFEVRIDDPTNQIFNLYGINNPLLIQDQKTSLCIQGLVQEECKTEIGQGYSSFQGVLVNTSYLSYFEQNQPQEFQNLIINELNQQDIYYISLGQFYDQQNQQFTDNCLESQVLINYTYCIQQEQVEQSYFISENQQLINKPTGCFNMEYINLEQYRLSINQTVQMQCQQCSAPKGSYLNYFCEICEQPYHFYQQYGSCTKCQYFANQSYFNLDYNFTQCISRNYGCIDYTYQVQGSEEILLDEQDTNGSYIFGAQIRCMDICPLPYQIKDSYCQLCVDPQIIHYKQVCQDPDICLFDKIQQFTELVYTSSQNNTYDKLICYGNNMDDLEKEECKQYQNHENNFRCENQCNESQLYFIDYYQQCLYTVCNDNSVLNPINLTCNLINDIEFKYIHFTQKDNFLIFQDKIHNETNLKNIQSLYKSIKSCDSHLKLKINGNKEICLFCKNYVLINESKFNSEYDFQCVDSCPQKYDVLVNNLDFNQLLCILSEQNCKFQNQQFFEFEGQCASSCQQLGENLYKNPFQGVCSSDLEPFLYLNQNQDSEPQYEKCEYWLAFYGSSDQINQQNPFICNQTCDKSQMYIFLFFEESINSTVQYCYYITDIRIIGQDTQFLGENAVVSPEISELLNFEVKNGTVDELTCQTYISAQVSCNSIDDCQLKYKLKDFNSDIGFYQIFCASQDQVENSQKPDICSQYQAQYYDSEDICINCEYFYNKNEQTCTNTVCNYTMIKTFQTSLIKVNVKYCVEYEECENIYFNGYYNECIESCSLSQNQFQYNKECIYSCREEQMLAQYDMQCVQNSSCRYQIYNGYVNFSYLGEIVCGQQCQSPYAINVLSTPQICYHCQEYIELLNLQNQSCMDFQKCQYQYNTEYCGLFTEDEEEYRLDMCQLILYQQNICQSLQQVQQNDQISQQSTQLECNAYDVTVQFIQNNNTQYCQISCVYTLENQRYIQSYITYYHQNQQYPVCQDQCQGRTGQYISEQNLTICLEYQENICLEGCLRSFANKTCADRNPSSCSFYQDQCYDKCPKGMLDENYICVKLNKGAKIGIAFGVIIFVILLVVGIFLLIKYLDYLKKKKHFNENKFNIQLIRSSKYQLQYEQTIV